jgi:thymidine phosphorylase
MKGVGVALVENVQVVLDVLLGPDAMIERLSMADNWSEPLLDLASKCRDIINHL